MELKVSFPGNRKVAVQVGHHTILTDQPKDAHGDDAAPSPFELFLGSIAACAGLFAASFCQKRGLSTAGLEVVEKVEWDDAAHRVSKIALEITLPADFPEKYQDALVSSVNLCTVKKHILTPPLFEIRAAKASRR